MMSVSQDSPRGEEGQSARLNTKVRHLFNAARQRVRAFIGHPSCEAASQAAFGQHVGCVAVTQVVQRFDRETWPRLVVVGPDVLEDAYGAYVATNDTIYLNREVLEESDGTIVTVLLHELGHAIGSRVQITEAAGDEGAIFAAVANGQHLSASELQRLRQSDDRGTITVGGRQFAAEFAKTITIDGSLADWDSTEIINTPANTVAGYTLYGTVQSGTFDFAILDTSTSDLAIGAGTTIWLNTDLNRNTGTNLFGGVNVGAEYNITFNSTGTPYLYTGTAGQTLVSSTPLSFALTPDGKGLEIAFPASLITPAGGTAPTRIALSAQITNATAAGATTYLPGDFTVPPQYVITDPASLMATTATHRIAIVYSDTSAKLYFNGTAYSDLFMAAQNQARMAGVSYDVIDESQLSNVANLTKYAALVFPAMPDVNTAQLPAIAAALHSAVYDYHIGIITSGDFLTNDQTGAALPGNPYANMVDLLGLQRASGGNSGTVSITANDVTNPAMTSYTAGQVIQNYANEGYTGYQAVNGTATDVLVNQNVAGVGTLPGVVQTTTGATNVEFATQDLLGDSNLLSHAIQSVVLGTTAGVTLHTSRQAGIVAARMDMDQSQYPSDVSPGTGSGIYAKLVPILQQWKTQYNFVGSYYVNVGNTPTAADPTTTNWAKSLPYYQAMEAMGGEIGNHSYTHLVAPPTTAATEATVGDTPAGATTITLSGVPSFAGVTVGMLVSGPGIGSNTALPGDGGAVANSQVTAVNGNTITISYVPAGYGGANAGTIAPILAGTTLTFTVPAENTNFLQTTGTISSAAGAPFTYDYEFNQSKTIEQQNLGTTIYGAAVPGANDTIATAQNIMQYYPSVAATATSPGYTGYVTGGWAGIGSGYPSAFGYTSPTNTGTVYLAPNINFDFTEIQYQGKTVAQAEADWAAQFAQVGANAAGTPIVVWPIHDYGAAAWDTSDSGATSPYTTQMFTDFIASAYAKNYEFVTLEQAASRIAAQQKASVNYTTAGNVITATATPDPTAPDLGAMALSVTNGGAQVIQNVGSWYAYNATEVFTPYGGGSFTVTLGATPDNVTHIENLPSRADLLSVTGDGTNLNFSMSGDGDVTIDLKSIPTDIVSIQGAPTAKLANGVLDLIFADTLTGPTYTPVTHAVSVEEAAAEVATAGNDIIFGTAGNDVFTAPGTGINTIYGDGGTDTIVFTAAATSYKVVTNADGSETITDLRAGSPDGTDTIYNIANVVFGGPTIQSIVASGPRITNGSGDVGANAAVTLTVTFSQAVTVAGGTPTLTLNDGGVATYVNGSGTSALAFTYTVAAGQNTAQLEATTVNLPGGATIKNTLGTNAILTPVAPLTGTLQVDTIIPTITAIATSGTGITLGSGDLAAGALVTLTVTLSDAVTVAGGSPTLTLNDGGTATYVTGSGTTSLTFNYVVAAGQNTPDLTVAAFNIPAGVTIQNGAGTNAVVSPATGYNPAGTLQIDTVIPAITSITTSGPGIIAGAANLGTGDVVTLTVAFSEAVTVAGGSPTLTLNDGGTATYTSGSGTNSLSFTYTVADGQSTADLIVASLNLQAGVTIKNGAGTNANVSGAANYNPAGILSVAGGTTQINSITTSGPGITNGAGDLNAGKSVTLTVNFSQAVTVAGGSPTLTLDDGGTATYVGGSGTAALTFTYAVAAGQNSADLQVYSLNLPTGTTLKDASGTNVDLGVANGYNPAGTLQIDTLAPTISSVVTSGTGIVNGAGTVTTGAVITLAAKFSETVTVGTGAPVLALNDGGTATYVGGSGTNTLTFAYTVAAGQNTTDLTVTGFSGATVLDAAGNPLALPIAAINPAGVLAISTATPTITVTAVAANDIVNLNKATAGFAIKGTTTSVENGQIVSLAISNAANQQIGTYSATVSGNAWSAAVPASTLLLVADGSYTVTANVKNKVGLAAAPATHAFTIDEDTVPEMPKLSLASTALTVTAGGSIALGITATPVDADDPVTVTIKGLPSYEKITAPTGDVVTSAVAGNGTFTWTVTGAAGATISGLSLSSSYTGTGHPVANLSITASVPAEGQFAKQTTAAQTLAMTDPPATTMTGATSASTSATTATTTTSTTPATSGATVPPANAAITPITSTMVLNMSEDAWNGNAQFIVAIDGKPVGGPYTVTASHASGQNQAITISNIAENFQPHNIAVSFINDAYGGTPATDRNLYLSSIQFDGITVPASSAAFYADATKTITASAPVHWLG